MRRRQHQPDPGQRIVDRLPRSGADLPHQQWLPPRVSTLIGATPSRPGVIRTHQDLQLIPADPSPSSARTERRETPRNRGLRDLTRPLPPRPRSSAPRARSAAPGSRSRSRVSQVGARYSAMVMLAATRRVTARSRRIASTDSANCDAEASSVLAHPTTTRPGVVKSRASMPALQELDAEGSLETRHPSADRGLGNAQLLSGPSQTAGARDDARAARDRPGRAPGQSCAQRMTSCGSDRYWTNVDAQQDGCMTTTSDGPSLAGPTLTAPRAPGTRLRNRGRRRVGGAARTPGGSCGGCAHVGRAARCAAWPT